MSIGIVGAGPAGMLLASLVAARGLGVILIDEQAEPGGHLRYDDYEIGEEVSTAAWLAELRGSVVATGVETLTSTVAWGAFRSDGGIELALGSGGREASRTFAHVALATGTTDVAWTGSGATLPGVMTARAIRILVNQHGVLPGRRIVVVGSSREANRLGDQLERHGCEVTVTESIAAIEGEGQVQAVILGGDHRVGADIVALAIGETPDVQLAGMLEAPRRYDPAMSGWRLDSLEAASDLCAVGGALRGPTSAAALVRDALEAADRLAGAGTGLDEARMPISARLETSEAVRR
jgi:NADPH-dependent 2,4-dienoyl-CoA reductase/sulfur reductase-like enzyme